MLGYLHGLSFPTCSLRAFPAMSEGDVPKMWSQRCNFAGFEDGEREATSQGMQAASEAGKDKETDSALEPPEGPEPANTGVLAQ